MQGIIHKIKFTLFAAVLSVILNACASSQETSSTEPPDRVSNIPWNKPQSWEGGGMLGSAMGGGR